MPTKRPPSDREMLERIRRAVIGKTAYTRDVQPTLQDTRITPFGYTNASSEHDIIGGMGGPGGVSLNRKLYGAPIEETDSVLRHELLHYLDDNTRKALSARGSFADSRGFANLLQREAPDLYDIILQRMQSASAYEGELSPATLDIEMFAYVGEMGPSMYLTLPPKISQKFKKVYVPASKEIRPGLRKNEPITSKVLDLVEPFIKQAKEAVSPFVSSIQRHNPKLSEVLKQVLIERGDIPGETFEERYKTQEKQFKRELKEEKSKVKVPSQKQQFADIRERLKVLAKQEPVNPPIYGKKTNDVGKTIDRYADKYIPGDPEFKNVLHAIVLTESEGNPKAEGDYWADKDGVVRPHSFGLFQANVQGGRGQGHSPAKLKDAEYNVKVSMPELYQAYIQGKAQGLLGKDLTVYVSKTAQRPAAGLENKTAPNYGRRVGQEESPISPSQKLARETFKSPFLPKKEKPESLFNRVKTPIRETPTFNSSASLRTPTYTRSMPSLPRPPQVISSRAPAPTTSFIASRATSTPARANATSVITGRPIVATPSRTFAPAPVSRPAPKPTPRPTPKPFVGGYVGKAINFVTNLFKKK